MWGQRQSAMIAEIMLLATGPEGEFLNKNIPETLPTLTNGFYKHYMPERSVLAWKANGILYFDRNFTNELFKNIEDFMRRFFQFCKDLKTKELSFLTNGELKKIVLTYKDFHLRAMNYFGTSTPSATWKVEQKIKEIIKEEINDSEKEEELFLSLSTPNEKDATMQERLDFLKLANKEEFNEEELNYHAEKYPALFFNTYSRKEVMDFLKKRIEEDKEVSFIDEERRIKENLKKIKKKHEEIYNLFQNEDLQYYSRILQKSALYRYKLKHVWSGAEYLCLDLLKEIQKRIHIPFDDFIKVYMFIDIFNFLEAKSVLTEKQVEERKKGVASHYVNGTVQFYFGQNALDLKKKFIGVENKKEEIRGVVANKGKIKGIVRIVHVHDLKTFTKDSALFERGEILVTTMTSPIMVPLIEKASGIITDEGGICSHAAVISREFDIPCIVGTKGASFILKTGDEIELDADNGIVNKA